MRISLRKPLTHAGATPAELVDKVVRVRPYYHMESETGSGFNSARARFTYRGTVIEAFGEVVTVRMQSTDGPWNQTANYLPRELHKPLCRCNGCDGTGINEERGA